MRDGEVKNSGAFNASARFVRDGYGNRPFSRPVVVRFSPFSRLCIPHRRPMQRPGAIAGIAAAALRADIFSDGKPKRKFLFSSDAVPATLAVESCRIHCHIHGRRAVPLRECRRLAAIGGKRRQ